MTAATVSAKHSTPMTQRPTRLARLCQIELRKATDTRAGRWLLIVIATIAVLTAGIIAFAGKAKDHTLVDVLGATASLTALLLPVLGVLLVTSEWSQRTALTTFTLVPRRGRIVAAKALAGVLLGVLACVVCALVAAVATAVTSHPDSGTWHGAAGILGGSLALLILNVLLGIGFGLLFLNTPVAIVVYFALPTAWSILTGSIHALNSLGDWGDPTTAWGHLTDEHVSGTLWLKAGVAAAIWLIGPLVAGTVRVLRRPIG
jgi:ABC-2 type transport system permease protein